MKAVQLHGKGDLRCVELMPPQIHAPNEVLIRVSAAGICGSDLHNFRSGRWIRQLPVVPGHEFSGVVMACGAEVRRIRIGDRVVADSRVGCGECPACREGSVNRCAQLGFVGEVCDGGFAEYVVLPEHLVHLVPTDLDPLIAALSEPMAVALHAVRQLQAHPAEPVLVTGAGTIGGLAVLLLRAMGHSSVYVIERHAARSAQIAAASGARPISLMAETPLPPVVRVIETTGHPEVVRQLIRAVPVGSRIVLVGLYHDEEIAVDLNAVVERELSVVGCSAFASEQPEALQWLGRLAEVLRPLVRTVSLADVPEEYGRLLEGGVVALKSIVQPGA